LEEVDGNSADGRMTRFLLGGGTLEEREEIESRLADSSYFEAMSALEDELIVRWHRGELPADQRRQFELAFMSSPARRARVEATAQLIEASAAWRGLETGRVSIGQRVARWLTERRRGSSFAFAAAAAALLLAVPVWVYMSNRVNRVEQENAALRAQANDGRRLVVAFALAPPPERGGPGDENSIRIPEGTNEIWLRFDLPDVAGPIALSSSLRNLEGAPAPTPGAVQVTSIGNGIEVSVPVPARELGRGDYVLTVRQSAAGAAAAPVGSRWFRVR
jgi:hypothetical protein